MSKEVLKLHLYDLYVLNVEYQRISTSIENIDNILANDDLERHYSSNIVNELKTEKDKLKELEFKQRSWSANNSFEIFLRKFCCGILYGLIFACIPLIIVAGIAFLLCGVPAVIVVVLVFLIFGMFISFGTGDEYDLCSEEVEKQRRKVNDIESQINSEDYRIKKKTKESHERSLYFRKEHEKKLNDISAKLNSLYNMDIIHFNYRNIKAIWTFYVLFDEGRVHNMTEAMNMYEEICKEERQIQRDNRRDSILMHISNQIAGLSSKMDTIQNQMLTISNSLTETNKLLNGISMNQKRIQSNQEALLLNTQVINTNVDTIRFLQDLNYYGNHNIKF